MLYANATQKILGCSREEALKLLPGNFTDHVMSAEEFVHLAEIFGAFWRYNYAAAVNGKPGKHALLKSGLHSDGFFMSKILLEPENIRAIMALQMIKVIDELPGPRPNKICGIPDGAITLAKDFIRLIGLPEMREVIMEKIDGKMTLVSAIHPGDKILMIEDFCTRGTGFKEAVTEIHTEQPAAKILPFELVMLNRGSLQEIFMEDIGSFAVMPIVRYPIQEWEPAICPLCRDYGSVAIKPKVSEESWREITTSQL